MRDLWVAAAKNYEEKYRGESEPLYLTLSGGEGREIKRLTEEHLVGTTEVGGIATESQGKVVAVESSPLAVGQLQRRFPGLKILEIAVEALVRGEGLTQFPQGDHEKCCRARIVNLDLNEVLKGVEREGALVFPVLSWITKFAQLHARFPRRDWCLFLTLHGEIPWAAGIGEAVQEFLQENLQRAEAFRSATQRLLGHELYDRLAGAKVDNLSRLTREAQQKVLMVFVPKKIAQLVRDQGWRLKTTHNLRYGASPHQAPMVSWIIEFITDPKSSRKPEAVYLRSVNDALTNVGEVTEDGRLVFPYDTV